MAASTVETNQFATKRQQLLQDGYCLIEDMLDERTVSSLKAVSARKVGELDASHRRLQKSTGSMIGSDDLSEMVDLFVLPRALEALASLGCGDCRFWSAYLINKPAASPQLFWHQDCIMWDAPRSYSEKSPMLFLMYYLTDTEPWNGCLRVLPGTHRRRHELHDLIPVAHTEEVRRMDDPDNPIYGTFDGEIDVPVKAGDLVLGDARMFHASHANRSDTDRTVITTWYHPWYDELAEPTQSWITYHGRRMHESWPAEPLARLIPVLGDYSDNEAPMRFHRIPGPELV